MIDRRSIPIIVAGAAVGAYHRIVNGRMLIYAVSMVGPIAANASAPWTRNNIDSRYIASRNAMKSI